MTDGVDEREQAVTPTTQWKTEPKAVEAWLRRDLAERYGPVLQEPLPEEWLAMLAAGSGPGR